MTKHYLVKLRIEEVEITEAKTGRYANETTPRSVVESEVLNIVVKKSTMAEVTKVVTANLRLADSEWSGLPAWQPPRDEISPSDRAGSITQVTDGYKATRNVSDEQTCPGGC